MKKLLFHGGTPKKEWCNKWLFGKPLAKIIVT
jgi:hypothetical protein